MTTKVFGDRVAHRIETSDELREIVGTPSRLANAKVIDHIDPLTERFIAACPLAILATKRQDGGVDQTPRGDPPGFIKVLSPKTLALPDRPGNRRMDSIENILCDDAAGLILMIPGHDDTIRISGRAAIVEDTNLSQRLSVMGKSPRLVILIHVDRVLCHCPKAFIRSHAWHPDDWPEKSNVPTLAELLKAHTLLDDTIPQIEAVIEESNTQTLY